MWKQPKLKTYHHHGFDFKDDEPLSTCKCGITVTNPYYLVGMNPANRMPMNYMWNDWGKDEDYFDIDGEQ